MAIQAERADARRQYANETELRMKALADELQAIALAQAGCRDALWSQLHQQEEASQHAGFAGVSRLCQQMQACLKEAQENGRAQLAPAAKAMLAVCRAIQSHAMDAERRIKALSLCAR
jgi:hypothetical protein